MTTFLRFLLACAVALAISASAQTSSTTAPSGPSALPSAPSAAPSAASPAAALGSNTGTKVGAINIEAAIFGCNEGQRDMQALQKKYEPKQTELKSESDELESLKKQLSTQGPSLNDDAAAKLKQQIEGKQKTFDRAVQDAQEEVGNQQQEIANRILQKMAPMIVKYAQENGFGMIIDTSKPWPQGPILLAGEALDITKPVVDGYNVQSGVPAPTAPASGAAKPITPKPTSATGTAKPAAQK